MGEPPVWEGQGGSWHSARRPSAFFTLRRDSSFLRVRKTCRAWSTETLRAQACRFDGPSEVNGDAEGSPSAIQRLARIVQADGPSEVNGDAEGSPSAIQRLARIVQTAG